MYWLTDTLKAVLVSVVAFSATVVLVIISFSRDPQPFRVSVAIPPLVEDLNPTKSWTGRLVQRKSTTGPHSLAPPISGKYEQSVPKPVDHKTITPATTELARSTTRAPSKAPSKIRSKTSPINDDLDPLVDQEGSVQALSRGYVKEYPARRRLKERFAGQFTRDNHPILTQPPISSLHSQPVSDYSPVSGRSFEDGSKLKERQTVRQHQTFDQLAARIGSEDAPAWLRYAATPSLHDVNQPFIAIVMDDVGLNHRASEQVSKLPGPLTLAFLPYADGLPTQVATARRAGHEVMVHVPMQPRDRSHDPGPNVLDSNMNQEDLLTRLDWALSRFDGYVGINNHMGSAFTTDPDGMGVVMSALAKRGLLFLDSVTSSDTLGSSMARSSGVPYTRRHVFIDHQRNPEAIGAQLEALESIAQRRGYAVGIGHPHQNTIAALARWLPTLREKGIALASVAHVVMHHQATPTIQSAVASKTSALY